MIPDDAGDTMPVAPGKCMVMRVIMCLHILSGVRVDLV